MVSLENWPRLIRLGKKRALICHNVSSYVGDSENSNKAQEYKAE